MELARFKVMDQEMSSETGLGQNLWDTFKEFKFHHSNYHEYEGDMGKQARRFSNFWKY